jgi:hypothetical protein
MHKVLPEDNGIARLQRDNDVRVRIMSKHRNRCLGISLLPVFWRLCLPAVLRSRSTFQVSRRHRFARCGIVEF